MTTLTIKMLPLMTVMMMPKKVNVIDGLRRLSQKIVAKKHDP